MCFFLSQNWLLSKLLYEIIIQERRKKKKKKKKEKEKKKFKKKNEAPLNKTYEIVEWKIVITNCRFTIAFIAFNKIIFAFFFLFVSFIYIFLFIFIVHFRSNQNECSNEVATKLDLKSSFLHCNFNESSFNWFAWVVSCFI